MKKVVLLLESDPNGGGAFQYSLSILDAVCSFPKTDYEIVVLYTNDVWKTYIGKHIRKIKLHYGKASRRWIQFLLMAGFPLGVIRLLLRNAYSPSKAVIGQKADLYILPSQESLWSYIVGVPSLTAIHDLMHRYERQFPEVTGRGRFRHRERHLGFACAHAKGLLVDSEVGKKQVCDSYFVDEGKVHVLPFVSPGYLSKISASTDFPRRYSLPGKYVFYPAQFWEHKNHGRLIEAVKILEKDVPDLHLVLVGSSKNGFENIKNLVRRLGLTEKVHFMGYVSNKDLGEFYRRARAMVMPTFFGPTNIPPLEAFTLGCPVAVSNVYGIPNQVGDAALLFDPKDAEDIANAVKRLWLDDDLCQRLIRKGLEKAGRWGQPEFNKRLEEIVEKIIPG
jgi:glycosyltransferase involved in cell wall biosynthesis